MRDGNVTRMTTDLLGNGKVFEIFTTLDAEMTLCVSCTQAGAGYRMVNAEWDDRSSLSLNPETFDEFALHLLCINKDVIGKPILDSQGQTIEQ